MCVLRLNRKFNIITDLIILGEEEMSERLLLGCFGALGGKSPNLFVSVAPFRKIIITLTWGILDFVYGDGESIVGAGAPSFYLDLLIRKGPLK